MIGEIKVDSNPDLFPGYYVIWKDGEVVGVRRGWPFEDDDYDLVTCHPVDFDAIKRAFDGHDLPDQRG